jgi:hypothetical protein
MAVECTRFHTAGDAAFASVARAMNPDRRWIFLAMFLIVLLPLLRPVRLPLAISTPARHFHAAIEGLPAGAIVVMPFDYEPAAMAEVHPMALAVLRRLLEKNVRVITVTMSPAGSPLADRAFAAIGPALGKRYGTDFVNLGYKSGNEAMVLAMGTSMAATFPQDAHGAPVASLPLMREIQKLGDADMLVEIAATVAAQMWVQQAQGRYHLPMVAGVAGVMAPEFFTYLQAGQIRGLLGGMAGAAEYESLVGHAGTATRGMDAQSLAHLLVIVLIGFGNYVHFRGKRRAKAALVGLLALVVAGCGRAPARNAGPTAEARPDTVREGKALVATYKDGPVSELRLVRDTSQGVVAWGETDFPEGTQVRVTLLTPAEEMLAVTTARVELGHFSSQPLVPGSGPLLPGLAIVRLEARFASGAQTDSILAVTDHGRRFRGHGMTPAGDHADYLISLEAPL